MLGVEWNQSLHRETKGKPWSHLFIPLENRSSPCLIYGLLNLKKPFQNWLKKLEKSKNIFKELESNSWRCRLGNIPSPCSWHPPMQGMLTPQPQLVEGMCPPPGWAWHARCWALIPAFSWIWMRILSQICLGSVNISSPILARGFFENLIGVLQYFSPSYMYYFKYNII